MDKSAKELNVSLLMKASVGIITAFGTSFVHADIEIAKNWLTQNNNNSRDCKIFCVNPILTPGLTQEYLHERINRSFA